MKIGFGWANRLACLLLLTLASCTKDSSDGPNGSFSSVKVFDDNSIRLPLDIVAGNGHLLCVYYSWDAPQFRFMLTDNQGNHKWTKDFGVSEVTGIVAESDGTFTIFDNKRLLNIDIQGNVLRDIPEFLTEIEDYSTSHVILNQNGNYFFYGTISPASISNYAFAFEITHNGTKVFKKIHSAGTVFTGCQQTTDGGYLFLGNFMNINGNPSPRFMICKMSSTGNIDWIQNHTPPGVGYGQGDNYYFTHELLVSGDGNYMCLVGQNNTNINGPARIYKIAPSGNLLDSTDINFAGKNIFAGRNKYYVSIEPYPLINGYSAVRTADGVSRVLLNSRIFEEKIPLADLIKGNQSFVIEFRDDLTITHTGVLQHHYPDYFTSVCKTSEGRIASFGMISSFGNRNKPVVTIAE